jgi:hypothetical protein
LAFPSITVQELCPLGSDISTVGNSFSFRIAYQLLISYSSKTAAFDADQKLILSKALSVLDNIVIIISSQNLTSTTNILEQKTVVVKSTFEITVTVQVTLSSLLLGSTGENSSLAAENGLMMVEAAGQFIDLFMQLGNPLYSFTYY